MTDFYVCEQRDLVENSGVCVLVDGQQVALFWIHQQGVDQVFALGNFDPFSQANVMSRGIVGCWKGELAVASPMYKQHFSLLSGQCLEQPEQRLPVYQVRRQGESIWVSRQPHAVASAAAEQAA